MELKHGEQQTPCWVPATAIGGKKNQPDVPGVVLETAFSSEGNYMQCKVEIEVTLPGWDGKPLVSKRVHPRPIQSYKLKKRIE